MYLMALDGVIVSSPGVNVRLATFCHSMGNVLYLKDGTSSESEKEPSLYIVRFDGDIGKLHERVKEGDRVFVFETDGVVDLVYGPVEKDNLHPSEKRD